MMRYLVLLAAFAAAFSMNAQNNNANFDTTQCINNNGLPNFCYNAGFDDGASSVTPDTVYVCDYVSYALAIEAMSLEIIALQQQLFDCQAAAFRFIPLTPIENN